MPPCDNYITRHDICVRTTCSCAARGMTYVSEVCTVVLHKAWYMFQNYVQSCCTRHDVSEVCTVVLHKAWHMRLNYVQAVLHEAWHMCQKYAQLCCTRHDICVWTTCSCAARGITYVSEASQLCCTRHDICVRTTCKLCCTRHDICVRSMHSCAAQGMTYVSELHASCAARGMTYVSEVCTVVLHKAWHMCLNYVQSCCTRHDICVRSITVVLHTTWISFYQSQNMTLVGCTTNN